MGYVTKLVEVLVCEHCGSEDCYDDRCLIPPEPYVEPDRVEKFQRVDEYTGILWDFRFEWRGQEVTMFGPYIDFPLVGLSS